ncbi:ATPase, T2SS/T4P/T4SS family [Bacillus sp. 445_BSPC]|uniref:ATPase, T2SS/T4P/T4SS family n=1 Tax=Bacillus sp. 445_BSPC TaxID=1581712 RepID=UPI0039C8A101
MSPFFFRGEEPLIQFRIDNKLVPQETLSFFEAERLIAHLKFLASMDIGEKRGPQSGAITIIWLTRWSDSHYPLYPLCISKVWSSV